MHLSKDGRSVELLRTVLSELLRTMLRAFAKLLPRQPILTLQIGLIGLKNSRQPILTLQIGLIGLKTSRQPILTLQIGLIGLKVP